MSGITKLLRQVGLVILPCLPEILRPTQSVVQHMQVLETNMIFLLHTTCLICTSAEKLPMAPCDIFKVHDTIATLGLLDHSITLQHVRPSWAMNDRWNSLFPACSEQVDPKQSNPRPSSLTAKNAPEAQPNSKSPKHPAVFQGSFLQAWERIRVLQTF